jgi:hypothetical protein
MIVGIHGDYQWEISDGELRVLAGNPRLGVLGRYPAPAGFNNAEQAQWFAQGKIDTDLEALDALRSQREQNSER